MPMPALFQTSLRLPASLLQRNQQPPVNAQAFAGPGAGGAVTAATANAALPQAAANAGMPQQPQQNQMAQSPAMPPTPPPRRRTTAPPVKLGASAGEEPIRKQVNGTRQVRVGRGNPFGGSGRGFPRRTASKRLLASQKVAGVGSALLRAGEAVLPVLRKGVGLATETAGPKALSLARRAAGFADDASLLSRAGRVARPTWAAGAGGAAFGAPLDVAHGLGSGEWNLDNTKRFGLSAALVGTGTTALRGGLRGLGAAGRKALPASWAAKAAPWAQKVVESVPATTGQLMLGGAGWGAGTSAVDRVMDQVSGKVVSSDEVNRFARELGLPDIIIQDKNGYGMRNPEAMAKIQEIKRDGENMLNGAQQITEGLTGQKLFTELNPHTGMPSGPPNPKAVAAVFAKVQQFEQMRKDPIGAILQEAEANPEMQKQLASALQQPETLQKLSELGILPKGAAAMMGGAGAMSLGGLLGGVWRGFRSMPWQAQTALIGGIVAAIGGLMTGRAGTGAAIGLPLIALGLFGQKVPVLNKLMGYSTPQGGGGPLDAHTDTLQTVVYSRIHNGFFVKLGKLNNDTKRGIIHWKVLLFQKGPPMTRQCELPMRLRNAPQVEIVFEDSEWIPSSMRIAVNDMAMSVIVPHRARRVAVIPPAIVQMHTKVHITAWLCQRQTVGGKHVRCDYFLHIENMQQREIKVNGAWADGLTTRSDPPGIVFRAASLPDSAGVCRMTISEESEYCQLQGELLLASEGCYPHEQFRVYIRVESRAHGSRNWRTIHQQLLPLLPGGRVSFGKNTFRGAWWLPLFGQLKVVAVVYRVFERVEPEQSRVWLEPALSPLRFIGECCNAVFRD